MKRFSKKGFYATLSVIVTMAVFSGCSTSKKSDSTTNTTQSKQITITIGDYPKETDTAGRQNFANYDNKMKEKYPNVTVKHDGWTYDSNTFIAKAATGELPTVFGTWFTEVDKLINSGYAADVTSEMKDFGYDKAINPDIIKLVQKDGKTVGLPSSGYAMGMWYNMDLFKQAGLLDSNGVPMYPKTFDELAVTAKTIKEKTGKPGFVFPTKSNQGGWMFTNVGWAYGVQFETKVDGKWKATFNTEEGAAALQYIKDLKWKYNVLPDNNLVDMNDMFKLFGTDQVGMMFGTRDSLATPTATYKMSKDDLSMSTLPAGPKQKVSLTGGGIYAFSNNASPEQIKAAFEYLEIMGITSKVTDEAKASWETQAKTNSGKGIITGVKRFQLWVDPTRVAAQDEIDKKYLNVNPALFEDYTKNSSKNLKPEEPIATQELYKALDSAIQTVLVDKNADPKKVLDQTAASFQKDVLDKVNN